MIARIVQAIKRSPPPNPAVPLALMESVKEAMRDVQAYARSHGGRIDLVSVDENGTVRVKFRGACAGCPMSSVTLRLGVEERLKALAPGVVKVVAV